MTNFTEFLAAAKQGLAEGVRAFFSRICSLSE